MKRILFSCIFTCLFLTAGCVEKPKDADVASLVYVSFQDFSCEGGEFVAVINTNMELQTNIADSWVTCLDNPTIGVSGGKAANRILQFSVGPWDATGDRTRETQVSITAGKSEKFRFTVRQASAKASSYSYDGNKISLTPGESPENNFRVSYIDIPGIGSFNGKSGQGFTAYGKTGFFFYDTGLCRTLDLENHKIIAEFALPEPVCNKDNHAGQANFGSERFDPDDEFPLLYLSSYKENVCYVLRVTKTDATLVQRIYLTDGSKTDGKYNLLDAQAFFPDGEKMVIKMGGVDPDGNKYKYWEVYEMPLLKQGAEYYLFSEKKSGHFYVRTVAGESDSGRNYYNAGCAQDGKIYVLAGFTGELQRLLVIDYREARVVNDIKWTEKAMVSKEQEQCTILDGALLINYNGADYLARVEFY